MSKKSVASLRERVPVRSSVNVQGGYRNHKRDLRADFGKRCGYCDATDQYFGGLSGAHIDHFAPKSKFPELTNTYENLVYSCPFCNRAKSNKWFGDDPRVANDGKEGFVDPCDLDFDRHLARRPTGEIFPVSILGVWMFHNFKMQLMRHRFVWQTHRLSCLLARLVELKPIVDKRHPLYSELLESIAEVVVLYLKYIARVYDE